MRKRIVSLCALIFGFAVGSNPQEIKPPMTLEVCNAQVNLWAAQTDISRPYGPEIREVMSALTSADILQRERVITDCGLADVKELRAVPEAERPAKGLKFGMRLTDAEILGRLYNMEQRTRYFNFISRNHLIQNFDEQDKAGER